MRLIALLACLACACAPAATADLLISVTGTSGSSIITLTISGTGTFAATATDDNFGGYTAWAGDNGGDFTATAGTADVPNDPGGTFPSTIAATSGALTVTVGGTDFDLSNLSIDDDGGAGSDFAIWSGSGTTSTPFSVTAGDAYTFSGTATFDMADFGAGVDYDDLFEGTFTHAGGSGIAFAIDTSVTISAAVPEPSSFALFAAIGVCAFARRRRAA